MSSTGLPPLNTVEFAPIHQTTRVGNHVVPARFAANMRIIGSSEGGMIKPIGPTSYKPIGTKKKLTELQQLLGPRRFTMYN